MTSSSGVMGSKVDHNKSHTTFQRVRAADVIIGKRTTEVRLISTRGNENLRALETYRNLELKIR